MWSFYFLYYYFLLFFRSSCHLYLYFLFFLRTVLIFAHVMRSIVGCSWMQSNDNISDEWLNWSTKSHEISYEITIDWANSCRIGVPLGRLRMPCFAANELVICFFFSLFWLLSLTIRTGYLMITLFAHVWRGFFLVCFRSESNWLKFILLMVLLIQSLCNWNKNWHDGRMMMGLLFEGPISENRLILLLLFFVPQN